MLLTAARSHGEQPILRGAWIDPGTVAVSIGSTIPQQREVDVTVIERSDLIVCDMVEEVLEHTGDLIEARRAGIPVEGKLASLSVLVRGDLDDRLTACKSPMFKSVGGGL